MRKYLITIGLLALSFVWLDYECYHYVGLSFIDYKCLPYATRLGYGRDLMGHSFFTSSARGGYELWPKWSTGGEDSPSHLIGFNGDTLIYITNIKDYGYSRKQNVDKKLIIHCAGENNDEFWIAPFPTERGYANLQIRQEDINLKDYKWIDLWGTFACTLPLVWVVFLLVSPIVLMICIIRLIIYAIRTIRQKHKPA